MTLKKPEPKPTTPERKPSGPGRPPVHVDPDLAGVNSVARGDAHHAHKHSWTCEVCGTLVDDAVCPVDGTAR